MDKQLVHFCNWQNGFSSYMDALQDHEASYECCLSNLCTSCPLTCRRSPRLLTNGYYILTEDSFLSDEDGNVTLSPSQTSVTYKEKLVRIFRRRRRIRRSLVSLFNIGASNSWLSSTSGDSSHVEDPWLEGDSKMETSQCYDNGTVDFILGHKANRAERHNSTPEKSSPSTESFTLRKALCSMIILSMCWIISLCVR
ncbi:transmembrane protein 71 [Elgaria multicarinata webbii]|uniref:transmembrane protein 71 n=1 Tax=Elgaria multicarinata webbii TaxID=159646 RepID=UPI002FCCD42D